jgi:hypothetical protein
LAAGQGVVHGLAGALIQNSGVTTLAAGHRAVVTVLSETVGETVTNENRLEVDVALLVGENLRSHDRDIVASVGLASNVEVLCSVLRELLEEQCQESIDVLASSNSVTDRAATVGVADIDGLVQEDHRGIVVPREIIVDRLDLRIDGAGSKFHEKSGEGRAAGTAVQPKDNGIVLGVIARLEEPFLMLDKL